jgi:hypothetical protein
MQNRLNAKASGRFIDAAASCGLCVQLPPKAAPVLPRGAWRANRRGARTAFPLRIAGYRQYSEAQSARLCVLVAAPDALACMLHR